MGSKLDPNGETASLKKRKREQKDDATAKLKRLRSKSKSKHSASSGEVSKADRNNDGVQSALVPVQKGEELTDLPKSSNIETTKDAPLWKVSSPMGGRMLDIDPIFSLDERHLILTYNTSIQIYSTDDSLLVRRIPLPVSDVKSEDGREKVPGNIVSSVLSKVSSEHIWVACSDGRIWYINWVSGTGADTPFVITKGIRDVTVEAVELGISVEDVLLVLQKRRSSPAQILAFDTKALASGDGKLIHMYDDKAPFLRSVAGARVVVAAANQALHVGILRNKKKLSSLNDLEYRFHSFEAADIISALDIRPTLQTTRKGATEVQSLDVVIGSARGAIYTYSDILTLFPSGESSVSKASSIQPRKFHWHQRAVHSVKWSEDGNYLISGGYETTLVLLQRDTGRCSFLPHLTAPIENIVVSPSGSSYAVHLDDNSTMVLSTAEMKPTTYVSGIQSLVLAGRISKDALVRRVWKATEEISSPLVAASNPSNPGQIYLCVGNGQQAALGDAEPSLPLLQSFDITSFQGVGKYALARTNPSEVNTTSQGAPIVEPRVTKLAFSHGGQWLASVDEWQPPVADAEAFVTGSKTAEGCARERRETYLKFWQVSQESNSIELVTRINEAHHTTQPETIFDLASDPRSDRFATLGREGTVKFWTSKLRQRDGLAATGPEGQQLRNWSCSRVVTLPTYMQQDDATVDPSAPKRRSGALTFSEDGSILFAAFGGHSEAVVVAIDTETGSFRDVVSGMFKGVVRSIKALGSCLIMLSDLLTVYDIVADELRYSFRVKETSSVAKRLTQLAVNYQTGCFALAAPIPTPDQEKLGIGSKSELVILSTEDDEPLLTKEFSHVITGVVSAVGSPGFIVVDSAAQIWSVTEGAEQAPLLQSLVDMGVDAEAAPQPLDLVKEEDEGSDEEMADEDDNEKDEDMEDYDIHMPVVAPQRLTDIWNTAPAFAMPPIEDLFDQTMSLFFGNSVKS